MISVNYHNDIFSEEESTQELSFYFFVDSLLTACLVCGPKQFARNDNDSEMSRCANN